MSLPDRPESPPSGELISASSSSPSGQSIGLRHALVTLLTSAPSLALGWRILPALTKAFAAAADKGDWKACAITGVPLFFLLLPLGVGVEVVQSLTKAAAKRIGG